MNEATDKLDGFVGRFICEKTTKSIKVYIKKLLFLFFMPKPLTISLKSDKIIWNAICKIGVLRIEQKRVEICINIFLKEL